MATSEQRKEKQWTGHKFGLAATTPKWRSLINTIETQMELLIVDERFKLPVRVVVRDKDDQEFFSRERTQNGWGDPQIGYRGDLQNKLPIKATFYGDDKGQVLVGKLFRSPS